MIKHFIKLPYISTTTKNFKNKKGKYIMVLLMWTNYIRNVAFSLSLTFFSHLVFLFLSLFLYTYSYYLSANKNHFSLWKITRLPFENNNGGIKNHQCYKAFHFRTTFDYSFFSRNKFIKNNSKGIDIYFGRRKDTATRISVDMGMESLILRFKYFKKIQEA